MGNTILIAEDHAPSLQVLSKFFTGAGFCVYTATTCVEAVKTAAEALPDCFVLDYELKDGPVPVVCSFIRGHERLRMAPIVIYSAHDEETENCYSSCQADVFVRKGRPLGELLAAVERHVRRQALSSERTQAPDLTLDPVTQRVLRYGRPLASLSPEQFRLFSALYCRRPAYVPERELAAHVFADISHEHLEAIFSLVYRLRQRLGPRYGRRIVCNRGRGWAYRQPRVRTESPPETENSPSDFSS